jgi:hypothetical protein
VRSYPGGFKEIFGSNVPEFERKHGSREVREGCKGTGKSTSASGGSFLRSLRGLRATVPQSIAFRGVRLNFAEKHCLAAAKT